MRKTVRLLIIGVVCVVGGLIVRAVAAGPAGGARTGAGSILIWVAIIALLLGAGALVTAAVRGLGAAWRWSSNRPAEHKQQL